jgi:chaperonin GroES
MFKPINNRVVVKPEEQEEKVVSGIIIAQAEKDRPVTGFVISGNDEVKAGDRILFSKFGYDEVTIDGEKFYVVSDFNILGIF